MIPFKLWWGIAGCLLLTVLIVVAGPYSDHINFIDNDSAFWYYWQLPESTFMGFITAWSGYACHQLGSWWLIAKAKTERPKYTQGLHPINAYALIFNVLFVFLHIIQTKIWYDGTAQTVSPMSAQFSVIFLLVIVLIIENPRRGMFFGKKVPIKKQVVDLLKKYHGYYFSWAIIYTFWFHPIELTQGHILGFLYIFMLMLQGSLFFTAFHKNKYWTVILEAFVLFHGAVVAYLSPIQSIESVKMFAFGFLTLFFVTQLYGLGLAKRWLAGVTALYLGLLVVFYGSDPLAVNAVVRVPFIEYGFALLVVVLLWLGLTITRYVHRK